jgi:hypothetical protein
VAHFGADQVFMDIDQIEPGEDFVEVINSKVGACDIAIVSIGPNWLGATDPLGPSGNRRLDDSEDFVRTEIVAALERKILVIPVLVGGARMPPKRDLPEALVPLSRRNAIELSETRFHFDVSRLIEAIEKHAATLRRERAGADAEKGRLAAQQRAKGEEANKKEDSLNAAAATSKEQPYVNSLGMKFVSVPGTGVLFSIWETRVKDYKVFVEAKNREWPKPSFQQTEEHPAVNVSWEDATAFCEWLTEQERTAGRISAKQSYRLPSDEEWSVAVGLEKEGGSTPKERDMKVKGVYPWGTEWPPPNGAGNYHPGLKVDDYENTSPAGSFEANRYGIHDLGGNVFEWCQDWCDAEKKYRVLRGASWSNLSPDNLLSSFRNYNGPRRRFDYAGFRCVWVVESLR